MKKLMLLVAMVAMALFVASPALAQPVVNLGDETDETDDVAVDAEDSQLGINDCEAVLDQYNAGFQYGVNQADGDDNRAGVAQSGVEADTAQYCANLLAQVEDTPEVVDEVVVVDEDGDGVISAEEEEAAAAAAAAAGGGGGAGAAGAAGAAGGGAAAAAAAGAGGGGGGGQLPDTGGAALLTLGAGALLVAGGLLARRIVR